MYVSSKEIIAYKKMMLYLPVTMTCDYLSVRKYREGQNYIEAKCTLVLVR